jgi:heptosyltransferase-2
MGSFNLANDLKKYNFDKIFIFNSSFRFNIIAKIAGIKEVHQYQLFRKKNQHLIDAAKNFLKKEINIIVDSHPKIFLNEKLVNVTKFKYKMDEKKLNILLGIGGSGPTKRIPSKTFINFMKLIPKNYDCNFFLATGKDEEEQKILNEILESDFKEKCFPLDNLNLKEIMPIIKNCKISICNDSSFSHLSAALGIETIVLMSDTPLLYGNYSPKMLPVIPDGESSVTHNTLGKDKINPEKILEKLNNILS